MGLRRSPYVCRRDLNPNTGLLAWDTLGLDVPPILAFFQRYSLPGPAARGAVLPPPGFRNWGKARRSCSRAGLPVNALRSLRAREPAPEPEAWLGARS